MESASRIIIVMFPPRLPPIPLLETPYENIIHKTPMPPRSHRIDKRIVYRPAHILYYYLNFFRISPKYFPVRLR